MKNEIKRRELKRQGRAMVRVNYIAMIAVCFVIAMLTGEYLGSTDIIYSYDKTNEVSTVADSGTLASNADSIRNFFAELSNKDADELISKEDRDEMMRDVLDSATAQHPFIFRALDAISAAVKGNWGMFLFLGLAILLIFLYHILVDNMLIVGERRFFVESASYIRTPIGRIFFLYRNRTVKNPAKVMFKRDVFQFLWNLTIIGGVIKHYEYRMIPYIIAENPDMDAKKVFSLSKDMMRGNKWRLFVLGISYWYWYIIPFAIGAAFSLLFKSETATMLSQQAVATLLMLLFLLPYKNSTEAQFFIDVRKSEMAERREYAELTDDALVRGRGKITDIIDIVKTRTHTAATLLRYPIVRTDAPKYDYSRRYPLTSYIIMFFMFAITGWLWEVGFHIATEGRFVNRGLLFGPWLPIYGVGGVAGVVFLRKIAKNKLLTFFVSMAICAAMEYATSYLLEYRFGLKWWDYSGYFLNLNGRICFSASIVFGLGSCAGIYILAPRINAMCEKLGKNKRTVICTVLLILFCADSIYSGIHPNKGKGVTDYNMPTSTPVETEVK